MFKNFITLAYRHFVRSPLTSFIQVFGLATAFTVSILVLLWIYNELYIDKFNVNYDRIYRLETKTRNTPLRALLAYPYVESIREVISEVENATIMSNRPEQVYLLDQGTGKVQIDGYDLEIAYSEKAVFDVFNFSFKYGTPSALNELNTIILTEKTAELIFGQKNPIGEVLIDSKGNERTVKGVIDNLTNFHQQFDALISMVSLEAIYRQQNKRLFDNWDNVFHSIYILLSPDQDTRKVEHKITELLKDKIPTDIQAKWPDETAHLRPLADIYFHGDDAIEAVSVPVKHGDVGKVLAFGSISLFCLLLASINFINLFSSQSIQRSKEICVKKLSGSTRSAVFLQLVGEVAIICIMSLGLAIVFAHTLLERFNVLMNSSLSMSIIFQPWVVVILLIGLFIIMFLAGGIPGFYISSLKPIHALKGLNIGHNNSFKIRKLSLILQFSITILLVIGLFTIFRQIHFMKSAELGYDKEQLLHVIVKNIEKSEFEIIKSELVKNPDISLVSRGWNGFPGKNILNTQPTTTIDFNGIEYQMRIANVDAAYLDILDGELIAGRFFDETRNDYYRKKGGHHSGILNVVLNESSKELLDFANVVGSTGRMIHRNQEINVIGVISDIHLNSMNSPIYPMIYYWAEDPEQILIKSSGQNLTSTIRHVENVVLKLKGRKPKIAFVDEEMNRQYTSEESFAELLSYLGGVVIVIGSMGLLGIFMHAIKIRIKEIGVRKVLGASLSQIINLLTGPILKMVAISSLMAVPIGSIVMNSWLANYPYRIEMDWTIYAIAIGSTLLIAALTIGWQCWQASNQNPARLIRYE